MGELWNMRQLCAYLGLSRASIYRLIKAGKIPKPSKTLTRSPRWDVDDLKKILKAS